MRLGQHTVRDLWTLALMMVGLSLLMNRMIGRGGITGFFGDFVGDAASGLRVSFFGRMDRHDEKESGEYG